jgi:hypothetical protein
MAQTVSQIRCPNCQSPIQASIEQIVDVGEDPSAKARLLSGGLNQVACPNCGYQGQLATPLVYHDADKELLLTYMPAEVGMNKDEQERVIGRLINQIVDRLPQEERKGYLLQPKAVLTMQGMANQILEADGITQEDIEAQQEKLRLFEQMIRTPDEELETFVAEHDEELNQEFFQLASLAVQSAGDDGSRLAATQRLEQVLRLSSVGKELEVQEAEIRAAAESLQQAGEELTRERLLDMLLEAPNEARFSALVSLTRPALDYSFFQILSERIDAAEADKQKELEATRQKLLELTQQIDEAQQAQAMQAANLLRSLLEADDLDQAIQSALPMVDELFLGTLQANISAAREQGNSEALERLQQVERKLNSIIEQSLPPSLRLAQRLLDVDDLEAAKAEIQKEPELVDDQLLGSLLGAASRLEEAGQTERAELIRQIHRFAAGQAMRSKMKGSD